MEKRIETCAIGGHYGAVVLRQLAQQEETKHAAFAVTTKRHACIFSRYRKASDQAARALTPRLVEAGLLYFTQRLQSARGRHRVP